MAARTLVPLLILAACASTSLPAAPARAARHDLPVEIAACVDLPRDDSRSHNLSGLAWDESAGLLYAISDRDPALTVFRPSDDFHRFPIVDKLLLDVVPGKWDGEAVTITPGRIYLANEADPTAIRVTDREGRRVEGADLPLPAHFRGIRDNLGLESVAVFAERYLFVANEEALESDGPLATAEAGTVIRILRRDLQNGRDLEVAYRTDPIFADGPEANSGVSDVAPLSPTRLLVLERGYVRGKGNSARIFRVELDGAEDVVGRAALDGATATVPKSLVTDLVDLPDDACSTPPGRERSRVLENYEGLALGPTRAGKRLLFLISDDNENRTQVGRIVVLSVDDRLLAP